MGNKALLLLLSCPVIWGSYRLTLGIIRGLYYPKKAKGYLLLGLLWERTPHLGLGRVSMLCFKQGFCGRVVAVQGQPV